MASEDKNKISLNKAAFYMPNIELPIATVRSDLTKTVIITILALILQFALAYYLQRGGWQIVHSILFNK